MQDTLLPFPFMTLSHHKRCFSLFLFNARSVGTSRKKTEICNFITDNDVDIMFLTETWLRPSGDEAKCADLAPPGYSVHSFPRSPGAASCRVVRLIKAERFLFHVIPLLPLMFRSRTADPHPSQSTVQFLLYLPPTAKQKERIYRYHFIYIYYFFLIDSQNIP